MINSDPDYRKYPPHPKVGVGVVLVHNGNVLLVKRGNPPALGEWTFPGGLINIGEPVKEAAQRELLEECGIVADIGNVIDIFEFIESDGLKNIKYHFVVIELLASYISGEVKASSDASDAKWVGLCDLEKLNCSDKIKSIVRKAFDVI